MEPYLVASSVLGIVAQRLVRRICVTCRAEVADAGRAARDVPRRRTAEPSIAAAGCRDCRGTGFRGRIGIFEVLRMTEEISTLVLERAPDLRIFEAARRTGLTSLREECLALAEQGETTLEEVLRVTQERYRDRPGVRRASPRTPLRSSLALALIRRGSLATLARLSRRLVSRRGAQASDPPASRGGPASRRRRARRQSRSRPSPQS